ncbi:MAG: response regulator [Burkholderiaceae bacterium]|jgi:signal transduction histidine kinase|nr:response regulator [Burkholderiaceae bacterium]
MERALRILVVDDDIVDRRICRRALGRLDPPPTFVEAETATQALDELARHDVDCVLLDFRLPDMDGLELLVRLNERSVEQRVPIIMLTGADDVSVAVEAMRRGASNYLVKDVDGRYQELMPTIVHHALRDRELQLARWHDEQALARYRGDLSDLAQRLMDTEKMTTRQLAQVLHDQLGQTLAAIRLGFDAVSVNFASMASEPARQHASRVSGLIDHAVREVRQVLVTLRPPLLDERGLLDALDNELRTQLLVRDDVELQFEAAPGIAGARWPTDVEYAAFMIAREAIGNALRHANASRVRVSIDGDERSLRLRVADDGSGIPANLSRPGHLGIVGMRERALAIGASFALESAPGHGTTVLLDWSAS